MTFFSAMNITVCIKMKQKNAAYFLMCISVPYVVSK